jgi:hypothetical protein
MPLKDLFLILIFIALSNFVSAGAWTKMADFGGATGRHRAIGLSIGNKGYIGTGHFNGTGVETYYSDWWEYDPATNAWSQKADYIGNSGLGDLGLLSIEIPDINVGYVGLGELDPSSLYKYDPATNSWSQVSDFPNLFLNFSDTRNLTIGHKSYFFPSNPYKVFEYDVDNDTWTQKNPPQYNLSGLLRSCFSINGVGYVKTNTHIHYYNPTTDTWGLHSFHEGIPDHSAQTYVQNNKAYFVTGYSGPSLDPTSEVWEFDPVAQTYIRLEDFPGTSRRFAASFTINGIGYLGTGTNGTNFKDFWKFDPSKVASTEEFNIDKFSAYPNPAFDKVNFRSDQFSDFQVQILSLSGQEMGREQTTNGSVSFSRGTQAPGMYIYKVIANSEVVYTGKILIQ